MIGGNVFSLMFGRNLDAHAPAEPAANTTLSSLLARAGTGAPSGAGNQSSAALNRFNPLDTNGASRATADSASNVAEPGFSMKTIGSPNVSWRERRNCASAIGPRIRPTTIGATG